MNGIRSEGARPRAKATRVGSTAAPKVQALSRRRTSSLPGRLPKATKLDVECLHQNEDGIPGVKRAFRVAEVPIGMAASGICQLPSGEMLAICDNRGICEVRTDTEPRLLNKLDDAEGITVDDEGKSVYVIEESTRRVHRFGVKRDGKNRIALRDARDAKKLPNLKGARNRGWEGIAFLPRSFADGKRDCLVCIHEASPRRIGIYALPDLDSGVTLRLPKRAKELLPDLSDVAVDKETGHIFVVSDRSRMIVELAIARESRAVTRDALDSIELQVLSTIDLPLSPDIKPEGLCFDDRGRLWIGLDYEEDDREEGDTLVLELER